MIIRAKKIPWYYAFKGLLGTKKPQIIVFHTRFGIHTFGMKYPIDVVILNKKGDVVKKKEYVAPNRFFFWNPKYDTVLELPAGTIQKRHIGENITLRSL